MIHNPSSIIASPSQKRMGRELDVALEEEGARERISIRDRRTDD